ncbi:gdt1-like protein 4 [Phtheirospermum japonicum]|uniref:Gdt1-like protein 4 n=1 Tax=Phtheirospermum japonicum TaxID=374723 RepID=A0A830BPT6_9LAMI|nr:gdt1-like protein 4 [Phtheirospermum japonicum]
MHTNGSLHCSSVYEVAGDDSVIGDQRQDLFRSCYISNASSEETCAVELLGALIVMNILSAVVGWAAPNLIPRKWTHHIKTLLLFLRFGIWSQWDEFNEGEPEDLAEVEKESNADIKVMWKPNKIIRMWMI